MESKRTAEITANASSGRCGWRNGKIAASPRPNIAGGTTLIQGIFSTGKKDCFQKPT